MTEIRLLPKKIIKKRDKRWNSKKSERNTNAMKVEPSQAQAHIVKAVAPNGSKYERVIGGYTDAQNTAFDLVSHGYKDVKLYHSVNAGPLKLLRNFSAPLHGAKFKDSDVSTDAQDDKKFFFQVFTRNGKLISKIKAPDTISTSIATRLAEQESKKFKKNWYKCQIVDQNGRSYETYYNKVPSYNGTREFAAKNMDSVDEIREKYQEDKLSITSNGFANGSGVLKKDTRKGLKPFEVNFYIKGKDGKLFKTGRSKMAASLNEAKQWANSESRKYKNVAKVEVKEFRDSVDSVDAVDSIRQKYQSDAMVSKSELDKKKYTQFFVNGEDINGKVLRIPKRRFNKFDEAVRAAKSLQNANTRFVYVEGGWDNNQVEPKALYDWRNPKVK